MKSFLPFALIGAVFLCAIGSGSILYHTKKQRIMAVRTAAAEAARKSFLSAKRGAEPAHVRGPSKAAVTLEEFADFQCHPCGDLSPVLEKLEQDYPSQLGVIFRQFPLEMHVHARDAARASEAAGLQGRFWEMHDLLYHNRFMWPRSADVCQVFSDYAKSLGLNVKRFNKDIDGEEVKERISADQLRAKSLGVDRTPIVFINNREVPISSLNPPGLHALIDKALQEKAQLANDRK
jgi:protein-disulfide isomerase